MSDLIACPKCKYSFELTEAIAAPLIESERRKATADAERRLNASTEARIDEAIKKARAESDATIANLKKRMDAGSAELAQARAAEVAARQAKLEADNAKQSIDVEIARRVSAQVTTATDRARAEALKLHSAELENARREIAEKDEKLAGAQQAEIAARRARQEAEQAKREAELTVERRLDEERSRVREQALKERDDEYRLKIQEKERQLTELKAKLDDAQRKADLGSEQRRGDVLEVDLYETLSAAFPTDLVERVKKGQRGGDVIHVVRSSSGVVCGRIKWESKHTQNWSDAWLPKLREDQREHKCDLAALMSEALPDGVEYFDCIEGVWVSGLETVVPMAAALRRGLIDTASARRAAAGAASLKDQVYTYLTGPEFRARVQGLVEPVVDMRNSLESEKRATARQFAAREKQIDRLGVGLAGMYGDLQGLVGASLPIVPELALPEAGSTHADALSLPAANPEAAGDRPVH
jgi:hypothetical protein